MLKRAARTSILLRSVFLAIGWLGVLLGAIGFFVPMMPSVMFFLIALWAFSIGSERFHDWLFSHRLFGPALQAWQQHRAIPRSAKAFAMAGMTVGVTVLAISGSGGMPVLIGYSVGCAIVAAYILSRPHRGPVPVTAGKAVTSRTASI